MSEAKHTPGPWKWQDWCCYGDPDEGPSKQTLVGPKDTRPGIHPGHILIVCFEEPPRNPHDMPLIAAAPEMYELLGDCYDAIKWSEGTRPILNRIAVIRAKIMGEL